MLDVLNHPQMLHSASVHMPIALAMLGIPLVFIAFVLSADRKVFRQAALICYVALIGSALAAVNTGEGARAKVPPNIRSEASKLLENHEMMAEKVWIFGLVIVACLGLSLINVKFLRVPWVYRSLVGLALLLSLFTGGWIAFAAHYGGELVYTHGIGTKQLAAEFDINTADDPETIAGDETDTVPAPVADDSEDEDIIPIREIDMAEAQQVSFVRDIEPIFEEHCIECHDEFQFDGGYDMTTVEAMLLQGEKEVEPGIVPGKPDESGVVKFIRGIYLPQMPKKADPLTEDQLHVIRLWIAAGAIDDTNGAPAATIEAPAEEMTEAPDAPADVEEVMAEEPVSEPAPEETTPAEEMNDAPAPEPAPEEPTPAPAEEMTEEAPAPQPEPAPEAETPSEETAPSEDTAAPEEKKAAPAPEPTPEEPAPAPEAEAPAEETKEAPAPEAAPTPEPAPEQPPAPTEQAPPPAPQEQAPADTAADVTPEDQGNILDESLVPTDVTEPEPPAADSNPVAEDPAPEVADAPPVNEQPADTAESTAPPAEATPTESKAPAKDAAPQKKHPYRVQNTPRGPIA